MAESEVKHERPENLSADEALVRLKQGNQRYTADRAKRPRDDSERREEVSEGQRPFATVLTCADSRVPPELIFDKGLGDLFVIRVAGNLVDDAILGSVEYASLHLGVNLIVVMGHDRCGAVTAAVEHADFDGPATHSHIDALIDEIRPAVKKAIEDNDGDLLESSIRANTLLVAEKLRTAEPILASLGAQGVEVHSAHYDLDNGAVLWLS